MKPLLCALLLTPCLSFADFSIEGPATHAELFRRVEQDLPSEIKTTLNQKITVAFKVLSTPERRILGRVVSLPLLKHRASHVDLDQSLTSLEETSKARATLLHEITHLYDFRKKVSADPVFLNIAGWQRKAFTRRLFQKNTNQNRRVDVYEDRNPEEALAVNVEHFLLDPEYKCRKPSLYRYLSGKLSTAPFSEHGCQLDHRLVPTVTFDGQLERQRTIDPARLYEVHYLFAGEGEQMMSRWGHAMLRLVMCAPSRTEVSEQCLQDRAYHIVLSFRADITNFNVNYIKGLTGRYTSKMFILSLGEVIKEYTVGELRHLYSIPLRMTPAQKELFVHQVLENYWGYGSRYFFVTNNCADETLSILRNVYADDPRMVGLNVLTPLGIRNKLQEFGISDMAVFEDLAAAKRTGHYFEGQQEKIDRVVTELKASGLLRAEQTAAELLNSSTLLKRKELATQARREDLGKLAYLEDVILNRAIIQLQRDTGRLLNEQESGRSQGQLLELYRSLERQRHRSSGVVLNRGYGIPQLSDSVFSDVTFTPDEEAALLELRRRFAREIERIFGASQKAIAESVAHKQSLLRSLR